MEKHLVLFSSKGGVKGMKGYVELSSIESLTIIGGKDSSVAKTIELIGYFIGTVVRGAITIWSWNLGRNYVRLKTD